MRAKKVLAALACTLMFYVPTTMAAAGDTVVIENVGNQSIQEPNPNFSAVSSKGMKQVSSMYTVWNKNGEKQLIVNVSKSVIFSNRDLSVTIWNNPQRTYLFTKKNQPRLVFIKNGQETVSPFTKTKMAGTDLTWYLVNANFFKGAVSADESYLELTDKDGTTVRVKIPQDVIKQWDEVINIDLNKATKDM